MPTPRALSTPMTPSIPMTPTIPGPPGPQGPPGAPGPALETLEQRLYDLLAPFRETDFVSDGDYELPSCKNECKALILCGKYEKSCKDLY